MSKFAASMLQISTEYEHRWTIIASLRAGYSAKEVTEFTHTPKTIVYRIAAVLCAEGDQGEEYVSLFQ